MREKRKIPTKKMYVAIHFFIGAKVGKIRETTDRGPPAADESL